MREIKFRAWDNNQKCMLSWNWFDNETIDNVFKGGDCDLSGVERFILMQYTGLKDKNGKEIYEGDIVEHIEKNKGWYTTQEYRKREVIRCNGYNNWTTLWSFYKYEIIGNIYKNPKLLEAI